MRRALLILDVQNDFCPGGALPVPQGDTIIPAINKISPQFEIVAATQDWHPLSHVSFARNHGKNPYETIMIGEIEQVLWPDHCVPGTHGAEFHRDLRLEEVDLILRKGNDPAIDSYSGFFENDRKTETGLHYYFRGLNVDTLYLCGLTTDYCVYYSAMDARRLGFEVVLLAGATKGLDVPKGNLMRALADMEAHGVKILRDEHL